MVKIPVVLTMFYTETGNTSLSSNKWRKKKTLLSYAWLCIKYKIKKTVIIN